MVGCSSDRGAGTDAQATSINGGDDDTLASTGEFSFFTVSLKFVKWKKPCSDTDGTTCLGGLGGDLRNGKESGIDGADSLCEEAANLANPGDRHSWRAFLSAGNYNGAVLNAIDRIGTGPWYSAPPKHQGSSSYASDGLLVAQDKAGLLKLRPDGDTTTIVYSGINQSMGAGNTQAWPFSQCLLNEYGDCTQADGDTHDTLTGSRSDGTYAGSLSATCDDWTNSSKSHGAPVFGHTWPRQLNSTDMAANWINTGENGELACGAVINVSSTNYIGAGSFSNALDGGFPGFDMTGRPDDGGIGAGGAHPFPPDGGFWPGIGPDPWADGGVGPGEQNPLAPGGGGLAPGGMGGGMGMGSEDSPYVGGVGSGGGYGAFYCFAYITGTE
jgi:hypothetical protein